MPTVRIELDQDLLAAAGAIMGTASRHCAGSWCTSGSYGISSGWRRRR
jgi:hypothetical protein